MFQLSAQNYRYSSIIRNLETHGACRDAGGDPIVNVLFVYSRHSWVVELERAYTLMSFLSFSLTLFSLNITF